MSKLMFVFAGNFKNEVLADDDEEFNIWYRIYLHLQLSPISSFLHVVSSLSQQSQLLDKVFIQIF